MDNWDSIVTKLEDCSFEVRSDKVTIRNKAVDQLKLLFDSSSGTVQDLLSGDTVSTLNPKEIFLNVFEGLLKHSNRLEQTQSQRTDNKVFSYRTVIQNLLISSNTVYSNRIPTSVIFEKFLILFDEPFFVRQCGSDFLRTLQLYLTIDNHSNFHNIDKAIWKRLLEMGKELPEKSHDITKNLSLQFILTVLELGTKYSYLADDLVDFVPFVETLFANASRQHCLNEAIKISFHLTVKLSVSYRAEMCSFTESISNNLLSSYNSNLGEEMKHTIFNFLYFICVLHDHPETQGVNLMYGNDKWLDLRAKYKSVVDIEMDYLNESKYAKDVMSKEFVRFVSYLYYLDFHNNKTLDNYNEGDSEPSLKRVKTTSPLEQILDKITIKDKNTFNWRWFLILSDIFNFKPQISMTSQERNHILRIMAEIFETLTNESQWKSYLNLCRSLLEDSLPNNIKEWEPIVEILVKCLMKNQVTFHIKILTVLIEFKVVPFNILEKLFQFILELELSGENLEMLNRILQAPNFHVNGELLIVPTDLIINYLNSSGGILAMKDIKYEIICEFIFLVFNNHVKEEVKDQNEMENDEFSEIVKGTIDYFKFKSLFIPIRTSSILKDNRKSEESKIILDESALLVLDKLFRIIFNKKLQIEGEKSIILALKQLEFASTFLSTLGDSNTKLESTIQETLNKQCFETLNELFKSQITEEPMKILGIVESIKSFLCKNFTMNFIENGNKTGCPKQIAVWLCHQIGDIPKDKGEISIQNNDVNHYLTMKALRRNFSICESLVYLSKFDGTILDQCWLQSEIHTLTNVVLSLEILKIISKQPPCEQLVNIALKEVKDLCAKYHKNQKINEEILRVLIDLLDLFKHFPNCIKDLSVIIKAYIVVCCKRKFCPNLTVILVKFYGEFFKSFIKHRTSFPEIFDLIMDSLSMFINSPTYEVRLNSVRTIIQFYDTESFYIEGRSFKHIVEFSHYCINSFSSMDFSSILIKNKSSSSTRNNAKDEYQNHKSISIQMLFGILQRNSILCQYVTYLIVQFCVSNEIKENIVLNSDVKSLCSKIIENNLDYTLDKWTGKKLSLDRFPWFLTSFKSSDEFKENRKLLISIHLLKNCSGSEFEDFAEGINSDNLKEELSPFLSVFTLPSEFYNSKFDIMKTNIPGILTGREIHDVLTSKSAQILQEVLDNFWDDQEFKSCFEFSYPVFETTKSDFEINETCLSGIMVNISEYLNDDNSSSLIVKLCVSKPFEVFKVMNYFKGKIIESNFELGKMVEVFKYFRLVSGIIEFIKNDNFNNEFVDDFKLVLIKDIMNFVLNVLEFDEKMPQKMKLILLNQLLQYIEDSFANCLDFYKEDLNSICCRLINLAKRNQCDKLTGFVVKIIEFFVIQNGPHLREEIEIIDIFPSDIEMFEKLRSKQSCFEKETLKEEIERFLKEENRSINSLRYLRNKIGKSYREFVQIYRDSIKEPESGAVKVEDSLLHKLMLKLLKCSHSQDSEIAIEAAKCLGEIGPIDLTTMVFSKEMKQDVIIKSLSSKDCAVDFANSVILIELKKYIHSYNAKLSNVAAETLTCLLYQPENSKHLRENSDLQLFHNSDYNRLTPLIIYKVKQISSQEICDAFALNEMCKIKPDKWITCVVLKLLKLLKNESLVKIIEIENPFSRTLLPLLTRMLLSFREEQVNKGIENAINSFFEQQNTQLERNSCHGILTDKDTIKLILDLVNIIRIYNLNFKQTISLEYLSISKSAKYCELYPSALLYGELWADQKRTLGISSENDLKESPFIEIMIESYEAIEQVDAVKPFLNLDKSRHKYFLMENAWELAYLDKTVTGMLNLSKGGPSKSGGFSFYDGSMFMCDGQKENHNYEVIWRLGDWSQLSKIPDNSNEPNFQKDHCLALKYFNSDNKHQSLKLIEECRKNVIDSLKNTSLNCTKIIYKFIAQFTQLQQLEDVCLKPSKLGKFLEKWKTRDHLQTNSFDQQEQIISQRISILRSFRSKENINQEFYDTILNLVTLAREERAFNVATYNLKLLETFDLDIDTKARVILEDGHLHSLTGHSQLAKHLFSKLINEENYMESFSKILALRLFVEHLTKELAGDPVEIMKNYLNPAEKLIHSFKDKLKNTPKIKSVADEQYKLFETTARFAESIYTQRNNYMKSPEYAEREALYKKSRDEMGTISLKNMSHTEKLRYYNLKQTVTLEEAQLNSIKTKRETFLRWAIKYYTKGCIVGRNLNDLNIIRVVSLWFTNISESAITEFLKQNMVNIPTYKFLNFLPQIAARLSHNDSDFTAILTEIMVRCCQQHPHHSLNHVLALHNAYEDNTNPQITSSIQTRMDNTRRIIEKIQSDSTKSGICTAFQKLSLALIKLANTEVKPETATVLPDTHPLLTLRHLDRIQLPTKELPVLINGKYDNITSISSWVPKYEMVGGINCPKKLYCRCSDGKLRSMLVKGKDDLRQDAVMQQVFRFMNVLLKKEKQSSKRNLGIRTYKIVPLTQMSGILEFCENTKTLGDYLMDAHKKYRPQDLSVKECRTKIADCCKKGSEERLKVYLEVCSKLKPIFQYFFMENFFSPGDWLEKRTFYINSVATTSMVGFILGIGDRHVNNILIDKTTAEVIHIDFGIAFERGKILPTPEQVPFRLTRDMVAAMGTFGVDGTFRKSCEITMQVLRENKSLINTIVEVLLYDPLYSWTSSNKKTLNSRTIKDESKTDPDEKNSSAARALLRVNEKLNGCDEIDITTVQAQVERLIQQAMSPSNLSQMFYGWQAYL